MAAPILTGAAAEAVHHRGSHMQIIASAGSGKTEVASQRVVDLLAEGITADEIICGRRLKTRPVAPRWGQANVATLT